MDDRLYRSVDDRMLAGVAGCVAERLDADPSIIRVVWALLVVLTGGLALVAYVVMAIVVPEAPDDRPAGQPLWQSPPDAPPDGPPAAAAAPLDPAAPPDPDAPTAATLPALSVTALAVPAAPVATGPAPGTAGSWVAPDGRTVARATAPTSSRRQRSGDRGEDRGPLIGGLVLILIGGFFLLRQFIPALDLGSWWPLILVAIGVILVIVSIRPDRTSG